ncbi:MAG: hypothetical protein GF317_19930 [Candidatus Lokiarchaeota archaeon]|nr:hypothetical protein [Candidatus Lokiarchaeota archaeon]MBD3201763.1 hypothetical protein [Candidatus Lokiarchaeota archaeon]
MKSVTGFNSLIQMFSDKTTIKRSRSISDNLVRVSKIDQNKKIIKAQIQGSEVLPYHIEINLNKNTFSRIIQHDCPDFNMRKRQINRFCKHITKLFFLIEKTEKDFSITILKELSKKVDVLPSEKDILKSDFRGFLNKSILKKLNFEPKGFEFFFDYIGLDEASIDCLKEILEVTKMLPAATGGYHGSYMGGLYDHTLLTTNYAFLIAKSIKDTVNIKNAVLASIIHDFGKIPYYAVKKRIKNCYIRVEKKEFIIAKQEIGKRLNCSGKDAHIEGAVMVLKKYAPSVKINDEILSGLVFHHGGWAKYHPNNMNDIATILHSADMIASRVFII